jgi:hypothetical protein
MGFLVPLVTSEGEFSEIEISEKLPYLVLGKVVSKPRVFQDEDTPDFGPSIHQENFKCFDMQYFLDGKRLASVSVYVQEEFLKGHQHRDMAIQDFINKNLPWVFTYASRKEIEFSYYSRCPTCWKNIGKYAKIKHYCLEQRGKEK